MPPSAPKKFETVRRNPENSLQSFHFGPRRQKAHVAPPIKLRQRIITNKRRQVFRLRTHLQHAYIAAEMKRRVIPIPVRPAPDKQVMHVRIFFMAYAAKPNPLTIPEIKAPALNPRGIPQIRARSLRSQFYQCPLSPRPPLRAVIPIRTRGYPCNGRGEKQKQKTKEPSLHTTTTLNSLCKFSPNPSCRDKFGQRLTPLSAPATSR
jgi:hypothetical protein